MIEGLIENVFWQQLIRFLFGSSILLLAVWGLESFKLIQGVETRAFLWKAAILGSVLLLLPISVPQAPVYYLQASNTTLVESPLSVESADAVQRYQAATIFDSFQDAVSETETPMSEVVSIGVNTGTESVRDSPTQLVSFLFARGQESLSKVRLSSWLLLIWIVGSSIALIRLFLGYKQGMQRLGTRREIAADDPVSDLFKQLCEDAGLATLPKLTRSEKTASPVTLIGNEICLPAWADQSLPDSELKSLLAHELGHVRHRDLQLLLGLQLLSSLFFFQPLFIMARYRLIDLSEFLADKSALDQCQNMKAITTALVNCADRIQSQHPFNWGFAMVGNTSRLKLRIQELRATGKMSAERLGTLSRLTVLGAVCLVVLLVPTIQLEAVAATVEPPTSVQVSAQAGRSSFFDIFGSSRSRNSYNVRNNNHQWAWDEGEAEWRNDFTTNDGEDEIIAITDGGYFEYRTDNVSPRRRIRIEADGNDLTSTYWVGGDETTFDDDGRQWFNNVLVTLFRKTGVNGEARVMRMLENAGPDAVITELTFIVSDLVSRIYNYALLENTELSQNQIQDLLETNKSIGSDLGMRLTLIKLVSTQTLEPASLSTLLEVAKSIGSDLEMRTALLNFVNEVNPSTRFTNSLLGATVSIGSDLGSRLAIAGIVEQGIMDDANWLAFRDATTTIGSDLQLRVLLTTVVEKQGLTAAGTMNLIDATGSIGSDLQQRSALSSIVAHGVMNDANWGALFQAADTIGSDIELRILLSKVIKFAPESELVADLALRSLDTVGSDLQMRVALMTIVEDGSVGDESWQLAVSQVEEFIGSRLQRKLALTAIVDNMPDDIALKNQLETRIN